MSRNTPINQWLNLSIVKNGTSFTYYQNGSVITTATSSISKNSAKFNLGGDPTEYMRGNIADVAVYQRALTATEVSNNFNATKSRFGL
jgi:hypothetical protein